jgi:hypothetical protein
VIVTLSESNSKMKAKATVPDLKELFSQAAEIAKQVPQSMQEAAFNRAVDLLTQGIPPSEKRDPRVQKRTRHATQPASEASRPEDDPLPELLSSIDSTQHPGIAAAPKVLDRALMLLQIALNDHNVDGLTPPQIAQILTEKFRVRTSKHAVSMALASATNLVNRLPHGQGFLYKIMSPGEAYLANAGATKGHGSHTTRSKKQRAPIKRSSETAEKSPHSPQSSGPARKSAKTNEKAARSSKDGPKAVVQGLLKSGYFVSPRTGPEIHDFLKKKRGLTFGIDAIRLVLLRLVRDEELDRDENDEGNYEYKAPKA